MKVDVAYYHIIELDEACADTIRLSPNFIGISVLQDELLVIREFVKKIKPLLPNTHITLGNKEVTCQPELIMKWCPEVDSVIIGERRIYDS